LRPTNNPTLLKGIEANTVQLKGTQGDMGGGGGGAHQRKKKARSLEKSNRIGHDDVNIQSVEDGKRWPEGFPTQRTPSAGDKTEG